MGPKSAEKVRDKDMAFINAEMVTANSEAMRLLREHGRMPDPQGSLTFKRGNRKGSTIRRQRRCNGGEREETPRVGLTLLSTALSQYKSVSGKWPRITWNDFHRSSTNLPVEFTGFETSRFSVLMGVEVT